MWIGINNFYKKLDFTGNKTKKLDFLPFFFFTFPFFFSIRSNDLASVADDCTGWNVLHHAVRVGDFALIKKLLSVLPQNAKDVRY